MSFFNKLTSLLSKEGVIPTIAGSIGGFSGYYGIHKRKDVFVKVGAHGELVYYIVCASTTMWFYASARYNPIIAPMLVGINLIENNFSEKE